MTKPIRCSLIVWAAFLITPALLVAQQKPLHINPVIAKLAEGKTVYGLNTGDLSLVYAREVARAPVDFIYADMEHNPLDFPSLHLFLMGMTDKAMVLKKGNRGAGPANATWIWGISGQEYDRHADLWPLNPEGDLLAIMMIESVEGLQNLDAIASTPGVGALFLGAGNDLTHSMGVRPGSPEVEAGFQKVLSACKAHQVACAITANNGNDVAKRFREGWNIIRSTVPAINAGRALLGEK